MKNYKIGWKANNWPMCFIWATIGTFIYITMWILLLFCQRTSTCNAQENLGKYDSDQTDARNILHLPKTLANYMKFTDISTNYMKFTDVYFSPTGGCASVLIDRINRANTDIKVQAYVLTASNVVQALIDANKRHVKVQIVVDERETHGTYEIPMLTMLTNAGVVVYSDGQHNIAHNKIMILDSRLVITGSYNFTHGAEFHNAENMLVIFDPDLAKKYIENWENHLAHSTVYLGKHIKASMVRSEIEQYE